jgi:hypothetical protein
MAEVFDRSCSSTVHDGCVCLKSRRRPLLQTPTKLWSCGVVWSNSLGVLTSVLLKGMCFFSENVRLAKWMCCVERVGDICCLELALARGGLWLEFAQGRKQRSVPSVTQA